MKQYSVYGIGNALVDMEFEVSAEDLKDLKIDKGVMTLIESDRQVELLDRLSDRPCKKACGGSAANTIVTIAQLGGTGFFSAKVANDETGIFYVQDLQRNGVSTNLSTTGNPDGISGTCLVFVTPDADRTMNTHLGISANFDNDNLDTDAIAASEYLYLEGYLVTSPTGKAAAIRAREVAEQSGTKTSFSLSDFNMAKFFRPGLLEIIGSGLDFIFANETEALEMAQVKTLPEAIDYLKTIAKRFAITRGPQGSIVFDGSDLIEIAADRVEAVDTVGAGDMYAGAFLYGLTHDMDCATAGRLASKAAARIVTRYGPRLEPEELRSLLAQF